MELVFKFRSNDPTALGRLARVIDMLDVPSGIERPPAELNGETHEGNIVSHPDLEAFNKASQMNMR